MGHNVIIRVGLGLVSGLITMNGLNSNPIHLLIKLEMSTWIQPKIKDCQCNWSGRIRGSSNKRLPNSYPIHFLIKLYMSTSTSSKVKKGHPQSGMKLPVPKSYLMPLFGNHASKSQIIEGRRKRFFMSKDVHGLGWVGQSLFNAGSFIYWS